MKTLKDRIVETARQRGIIPSSPHMSSIPLPAINKVEWYLTFHCNDCCAHCITNSSPEREETITPDDARRVINNIREYSILKRLRDIFGDVEFRFKPPDMLSKLEKLEKPPERLTDSLMVAYDRCLMGEGYVSEMISGSSVLKLPFGKPSIRLSGGEFSTWPCKLNGKTLSEESRLCLQRDLLSEIRGTLPEYDIWILTNGRFATSQKHTNKVISHWAKYASSSQDKGKIRICLSVDAFHQPPPGSSVEEMLERVWIATREYGLAAPFLYGNSNRFISYIGRPFDRFRVGTLKKDEIRNVSKSSFNPITDIVVDPMDLVSTDGCNETKGFFLYTDEGALLATNININPCGNLCYCCACVGNYGDFIKRPEVSLKMSVRDPLSLMLRRAETAATALNMAVELDPTIRTFGSGEHAAATGSTCYQMMTGVRMRGDGQKNIQQL